MELDEIENVGEFMKWISVNEKLPIHHQTVYVYTKNGCQAVCIFIDGKILDNVISSVGSPKTNKPFYFCSQEFKGNELNGVTHWMPLPEAPK